MMRFPKITKINITLFIFVLATASIFIALALYATNLEQIQDADQQMAQEMNEQINNTSSEQANKNEQKFIILETEELIYGTGREAKNGNTLSVHYIGTLLDGTKFDSSYDRNEPFSFILGAGEVIEGWDRGFEEMKEGGKRKLTIPPEFGYGDTVAAGGKIPPNSTLIFEIELLKVE